MARWIFEDDDHFLRCLGIIPWPDYKYYKDAIMEDRMEQIYKDFQNSDEAFSVTDNTGGFESIDPSIQSPELDESNYRFEVKQNLATAIQEFLTFSDSTELLKFITKYI